MPVYQTHGRNAHATFFWKNAKKFCKFFLAQTVAIK